jgi:hypothetical protein
MALYGTVWHCMAGTEVDDFGKTADCRVGANEGNYT